jgi:hypothetical protein
MKSWFPFTDYDFYAYITSGVIVIAGVDYALFGGVLVNRTEWTVVQGIFWTMISYLVGHISAGLSSFALEKTLAKKMFRAPESIILGLQKPRWFERVFKSLLASEYSAFPQANCDDILDKLAVSLKCDRASVTDPEAMFQTAFGIARYEPTSEVRLNQFMNLYGLCRNVAFAFLLVAILLIWKRFYNPTPMDDWLLTGATIMVVGMFGRFLKFYSAYTRETFRIFGRKST